MNTASAQTGTSNLLTQVKSAKPGTAKTKSALNLAEQKTIAGKKDFREILRRTLNETDNVQPDIALLNRGRNSGKGLKKPTFTNEVQISINQSGIREAQVKAKASSPEKDIQNAQVTPGINQLQGLEIKDKKNLIPNKSKDAIQTPGDSSLQSGVIHAKNNSPREIDPPNRPGQENVKEKLTIVDRRRSTLEKETKLQEAQAQRSTDQPLSNSNQVSSNPSDGANQQTVRLEGPATGGTINTGRTSEPAPTRGSSGMQAAIQTQLHSEFLDRAKIIMKDGGGEIRMTLRPQSLGSLRLSVSLEERVLKGHIVVDNESVKEVVENQLDSLLRSFREGGFDPLELTVSIAGENSSQREGEQTSQQGHKRGGDSAMNEVLALNTIGDRPHQISLEA